MKSERLNYNKKSKTFTKGGTSEEAKSKGAINKYSKQQNIHINMQKMTKSAKNPLARRHKTKKNLCKITKRDKIPKIIKFKVKGREVRRCKRVL